MKKIAKTFLVVCLCVCLLVGSASFVFAASEGSAGSASVTALSATYADQWEYQVSSDGTGYYMLDAVYCTNPVDPELQHLVIYAPEAYMTQNADGTVSVNPDGAIVSSSGVTYTAQTAPIIYFNNSDGYSSCTIMNVENAKAGFASGLDYMSQGYVAVSMATRGKESQDANGKYIGQFPAIMVDLKAGIRFLKYFDDELPGDSDRIVSIGASSGGGVTAMLAASGNASVFDSYLEEIGAYDSSDDIFMAIAGAPITNLSSADASYEWFQAANTEYFLFDAMAYDREGNYIADIFPVGRNNYYPLGSNILGGEHEDELSALLYDWYVDYVQSFGLDLGDDGRSGSYFTGFEQLYSDSLNTYMHRYDEVGDSKYAGPQEYMEYLNSLSDEPWVVYDAATDTYSITSFDEYVSAYLDRNKMCPSLDSYNYKSNENSAFVDEDGNSYHFSATVRDMLKILLDNEDDVYEWDNEINGEFKDAEVYIRQLYEDYDKDITEESAEMLEIMSPINYIVAEDEMYQGATIAPYWRLRIGSSDGDHGAPAAWLIAEGLEKYTDAYVDMGISWAMGHGQAELTQQDAFDYIDWAMTNEGLGKEETGSSEFTWEYAVANDGTGYYMTEAVYCTNPVDPDMEYLAIYVPEAYMTQNADGTVSINPNAQMISSGGVVYTAETAPIIYFNNSGGYSCCTVQSGDRATGYLNEGYVAVSMATRGKESQDENGLYIGQFPAIMVDLKAGIRFLKYYDDVLPGNSDRIVSIGASSGGGVTTMLAASGNSPIFDSYLEEIGAYDTSDDIFMGVAGAPITNLSSADASYEWFQIANTEYFLFDAMAYDREGNYIGETFPVGRGIYYPLGSNVLGGAHEDELSALLYDWYVDYVQGLGLDLGDDGRSGSYFTGFEQLYSESLNTYMHRYDEVGDSKYAGPAEYMEYLNSLSDEPWVLYDAATDTYSITSFDDYVSAFLSRNKMCPSLDSYNYKSNENDAFVDPDGTTEHFSGTVRDMLKILMDDEDGIYNWADDELEYITELFEDYDRGINDESTLMLEIMSPINYILETDEMYEGATMAPYWRLRIGSSDGDHGAPAAWLIAEGLEANHPEVNVDMAISWAMPHGQAELTDQDLYDYIDDAMVTEDGLPVAFKWEYAVASDGTGYYMLDAVYCTNPVDPQMQHLVIYAPEAYMTQNADGTVSVNPDGKIVSSTGVVYTAETAPIMYYNTSGGYSSSSITAVDTSYLKEGYVHVSVATRGKDSQDADGNYIGQFPLIIVDLKAGVRFLKYYDDVLPGNSDRIISRGYSSGGAVGAMLGASGNSPLFDSYLEDIGAYDATDDIFITLASAPITNLSSADASYEWFQAANTEYFLFNAMAYDREGNNISDIFPVGRNIYYPLGSNILGGAHEDELSALLYDWYVDYVQSLGFDLGDDGRSGSFYEGFVQIYSDSLTEYVARFDELNTNSNYATAQDYLDYLATLSDEPWFTYDESTGEVTIVSLDAFVSAFLDRNKMCPSLDSYNYKSNENDAFKDADGNTVHFSATVRDMLKILMDDEDGIYNWTEDELEYITLLYGDYDSGITDESTEMLEIMSPINYIVAQDEMFQGATISPYWRLRVGSSDGDHGAPAAWLIAEGLEMYTDADVSVGIAWNMGHSLAELTDQDLYDYIGEIMLNEDGLDEAWYNPYTDVSSDAWYYDAVEWVTENGLMIGMTKTTFEPDTTASRAMFVTTLYRQAGSPAVSGTSGFSDVPSNAWFADSINWAAKEGIVTGYDEGAFKPDDPLTREQMVTILYRYVGCPETAGSLSQFSDAKDVSDYAKDAMCWAVENGIIEGRPDGTLDPQAALTRAELATILMRYFGVKEVSLEFDAAAYTGTYTFTYEGTEYTALCYEDITYCATPNAPDVQILNLYVLEDMVDDHDAPIFMVQTTGQMCEAYPVYLGDTSNNVSRSYNPAMEAALANGYVVVSAGARGQDSVVNGEYVGRGDLPMSIVDLKAAVRYLYYNEGVIPGDPNKIIEEGSSSGGGMSAVLGASGNSELYLPYLEEIGAADTRDDIYCCIVDSAITDFAHIDLAYEWQYSVENVDGLFSDDPDSTAISIAMGEAFEEYINSLNLKVDGEDIGFYDSGDTYTEFFIQTLEESMTKYLRSLYEDGGEEAVEAWLNDMSISTKTGYPNGCWVDWDESTLTATMIEEGYEYECIEEETTDWQGNASVNRTMTLDENGNAIRKTDGESHSGLWWYINWNAGRWMMYIGCYDPVEHDSYEAPAFAKGDATTSHFDPTMWQIIVDNGGLGSISKAAAELSLAEAEDNAMAAYMLDPMGFLTGDAEQYGDYDIAPVWYVRDGGHDETTGALFIDLVLALQTYCPDVTLDYSFSITQRHTFISINEFDETLAFLNENVKGASSAAGSTEDPLLFDAASYDSTYTFTYEGTEYTALCYEGIPYCTEPNAPEVQVLNLYVLEDMVDDHDAPIFMVQSTGQMNGCSPEKLGNSRSYNSAMEAALANGYVVVSPGARGQDTLVDGEYVGRGDLPMSIVDLKAAVRYLHYNEGVIPGDPNKIIEEGSSSGGGMSAVLGASGNSELYLPYLEEIGAADAADDIYCCIVDSPITDFAHIDLAYEWMFGVDYADGLFVDDPDSYAISVAMAEAYEEYVNSLEFVVDGVAIGFWSEENKGPNGETTDTYTPYLTSQLEAGVEKYLMSRGSAEARQEWINGYNDKQYGESHGTITDNTAKGFTNGCWFTWDEENQKATMIESAIGYDGEEHSGMWFYINMNAGRWMMYIGCYDPVNNGSFEASAFIKGDEETSHFDPTMWEIIYEAGGLGNTSKEAAALNLALAEDNSMATLMLNPIAFLTGEAGDCDVAPVWYVRCGGYGETTGDLYLNIILALQTYYPDATLNYSYSMTKDHSAISISEFDETLAFLNANVK